MRLHLAALIVMALPSMCLGAHPVAAAQEPSAAGLWQSTEKIGGWFLIYEHGGVYEGAIVKMYLEPGWDPNPVCTKCEGDQKNTPWLGLTIIKGMGRKGLDYENGTILDPRDGWEYHALMHVSPDGQELTVRGYLGISLLGRDQLWKRLPDSALAQLDPSLTAGRIPPSAIPPPNPALPKSGNPGGPAGPTGPTGH
jgi:hypothetical protein